MAQALKAVAARKGRELMQHREISQYARSLAAELGDEGLWLTYVGAQYLHSGFYEVNLTQEAVAAIAD